MSLVELAALVGTTGLLKTDLSLRFVVKILDVKTSYGVERLYVTPLVGDGKRWVNLENVVLDTAPLKP